MPYWDERFAAMAKDYPDVKTAQYHIDILTAHFVQHPDWFDVVVGSNLFGDILSDLGPAFAGSIGIAPGGNINPGAGIPLDVRAGARLGPRHRRQGHRQPDGADLVRGDDARAPGPQDAADAVVRAIEKVVEEGKTVTRDLGGKATTQEVGEALVAMI